MTSVRVSSPTELALAVPHVLGFAPTESLVIMTFSRRQIGLTCRYDLDALAAGAEADALGDVAEAVESQGDVDACVVMVFTDLPGERPHEGVIDALRLRLPVIEALLIRDGRCWSYVCTDAHCCPPDGRELVETEAVTALRATYARYGQVALPTRADLARSVAFQGDPAMVEAFATYRPAQDTATRSTDAVAAFQRLMADAANDPRCEPTTEQVVSIVTAVTDDVTARDRIMIGAVNLDQHAVMRMTLERLCRRTPDGYRDAPLTMMAALAYSAGDGALANICLDEVAEDYSLANLLRFSLSRCTSPEVFREVLIAAARDLAG